MKRTKVWFCLFLVFALVFNPGLVSAAPQPIPGIPESPNAGPSSTAPLRQSGLTCNPNAVFNPDNILFDDEFGMPVRLGYRTVQEYYAEMRYLAQAYPEIVKLHTYGTSKYYKWPLLALEVSSNPGGNDGRPGTMHQAGNHPREWQSNELCMDLAWYMITQYGKIADVTDILNSTTVWFLPMTNPDGVHYDMTVAGPGVWRGNLGGANGNTIGSGADLNRNWPYGWGSSSGSSSGYGTNDNRGSAPQSEPEISSITALARSNMMITSISGHQFPSGNGQYLVFPWAFFINESPIKIDTPNGQVDIRDLGYQQSKYNLHSAEYTNIMYPYSGESGDYLYGALGTLPFLYEYGRYLMQPYMGTSQNFATTNFNDLYTGKQREFLVSYAKAPSSSVTAQMVFITDDGFVPKYGPITATTTSKVNALGSSLNGKILVCVRGATDSDNGAIALAAQNLGAVGVLFCTRLTSLQGYQHSHYSPGLGGTSVNIPVAGAAKQYLRELYERSLANSATTLTFNTGTRNLESNRWQFERNLGAFIENMLMASEYSSHIKGSVSDSKGSLITDAELNLKKQVFSPLIEGNSSGYASQISQSGLLEQTQTGVYNVKGGAFDWSVTPSKQPNNPVGLKATQFADLGYDITAKAPGGYYDSFIQNVKVPQYQYTANNFNFALQEIITTDFDFNSVYEVNKLTVLPFTTFVLGAGSTYSPGDVSGLTVTVGGAPAAVTSLGNGQYEAAFTAAGEGGYEIVINFSSAQAHSAYTNKINFGAEVSPTFIYGDVNDDGNVNMSDLFILARHIANWPGYEANTLNMLAADVNDDGKVNMPDLFILARHIANWPGYEVFPYK